ncbi:Histone-lysine N-methyltransferase 2E [Entomophthora muscae]|uniref:Histone-lysine N-methyltransferase 2E n=1 Tax=Entomophthora muscae TaxID=34485 RepID=A0ACC2SZ73_9FUNG|nr:Histone-lysine N-methyltransferase 2E [Entomophthora muscae]
MDKYPIESGVIRCICDLDHDDGFTIQCDSCEVWQHAECVDIEEDRVPKDYYCDLCQPRNFDKERAVKLQQRKIKDKGRRKYKVKRPDGRTRKTSKAPTQNSSAAPSPSASVTARQPGRKKKKAKLEIESPDTTNQSPGASLIPDAEDLMIRICQGLLSSKTSGRKKNPASLGHSPTQAPPVLEYTLCPSHSTFEADPSDILVLDQDFMER